MTPVGSGKSNTMHHQPEPERQPEATPSKALPLALDAAGFWQEFLHASASADARDDMIYATLVTERIVTAQNKKLLTREQHQEWTVAVEYFRMMVDEGGVPASDLIAEAYRHEKTQRLPMTSAQRKALKEADKALRAGPAAMDAFTAKMMKRGGLE